MSGPPPGWPEGVPPVPAQARFKGHGDEVVRDMAYQRWCFGPKGLISYTAYDGKTAGTITKGPGST